VQVTAHSDIGLSGRCPTQPDRPPLATQREHNGLASTARLPEDTALTHDYLSVDHQAAIGGPSPSRAVRAWLIAQTVPQAAHAAGEFRRLANRHQTLRVL
jgi:hypothetical protein